MRILRGPVGLTWPEYAEEEKEGSEIVGRIRIRLFNGGVCISSKQFHRVRPRDSRPSENNFN